MRFAVGVFGGDGADEPVEIFFQACQAGFAGVYGEVPADQAEFISTPDSIKQAAVSGAPTMIWETLEHGEKVECLDCIPLVAPLLYDATSAKTREIAAWWLRRRLLGVFQSGLVYDQTLSPLAGG